MKETFNPKTRKFQITENGHIDSIIFREKCLRLFNTEIFQISHIRTGAKKTTVGYSKRVY